jgi:hypothetical protein
MPEPPLSPSQQVERIREILVGRQMQVVEERLERLERLLGSSQPAYPSPFPSSGPDLPEILAPLEESALQGALQEESTRRDRQISEIAAVLAEAGERLNATSSKLSEHDRIITQDLRTTLEKISSSVAERVDARVREVLDHLQAEIDHVKHQLGVELQKVSEDKADRAEVRDRFTRLAAAAMETPSTLDPREGFVP